MSAHRSGRAGWFVLLLIVIAAAAVVVFAGGKLRSLLGIAPAPAGDGNDPAAATRGSAPIPPGGDPRAKAAPSEVTLGSSTAAAPAAAPNAAPAPQPAPQLPAVTGEAAKILQQAEAAFAACRWQEAASLADRAGAAPRAKELAVHARAITELFARLDEKDELTRNYDTSPALVSVTINGRQNAAVPVTGSIGHWTPIETDPVGAVRAMNTAGHVSLLLKGVNDFIYGDFPSVDDVTAVDQQKTIAEAQTRLADAERDLRAGADARDATAWYGLARFAYRNRIDQRVPGYLDQALTLDPSLLTSVREDKAARLFAAMTFHFKNRNRTQADVYKGLIAKRYADTEQGRAALAYYAEETGRLAKVPAAPVAPAAAGGQPAAAPAAQPVAANPAQGGADASFAAGIDAMRQADQLGPGPQRNALLHQAELAMAAAAKAYQQQFQASGDTEQQRHMEEANRMKFWAHKGQTL